MMMLQARAGSAISTDLEQIARVLPIRSGERLIELGCGRAETTRLLAERFPTLEIISTEVDRIQHDRNLDIEDLPNVDFRYGGAQEIESVDGSANYVIMLKSLHHVPVELMEQSMREIRRVLKPGGLAYISEPIFAGVFNDILRIFHDEEKVRSAAFATLKRTVESGAFELVEQVFFDDVVRYEGFEEFEERVFGVTHSTFDIDEPLLAKIKHAFESHLDSESVVEFHTPQRVDLLRRPSS
jgi:ubiquinone/menaquinone biosynthesis C-methylase UbiE